MLVYNILAFFCFFVHRYDYTTDIIAIKKRKWGVERAKKIYKRQQQQRLDLAELKQKIEPYRKQAEISRENSIWNSFQK